MHSKLPQSPAPSLWPKPRKQERKQKLLLGHAAMLQIMQHSQSHRQNSSSISIPVFTAAKDGLSSSVFAYLFCFET